MGISNRRPPLARLMAFIDGGYLREQCKRKIKTDTINFNILRDRLEGSFTANCRGKYSGDLTRVYYYDAMVDHSDPEYDEQNKWFSKIKSINGFEVRLGRLVRTGQNKNGPFKQKGVDTKLAIDMISKAYQGQYDFALLLAGDNDFLDLVEAVKDSNRRVYGFYFIDNVSKELLDSFDQKIPIDNFVNELNRTDY
ncbi:MAG: NYN domain-containing protein [Nitrosopumilaceae archaeon]